MLEKAISLPSLAFAKLLMLLWSLWKNKNDKLWNDVAKPGPVTSSLAMAWHEEFLQVNQSSNNGNLQNNLLAAKRWLPPPDSYLILNVDVSCLSSNNFVGVGGVLCNSTGAFIAGFSHRKSYVSSPLHIELLAIYNALLFVKAMELSNVIIHSDCLLAVQAINSDEENLSSLGSLIDDIKALLHESPLVSVHHASRGTNFVAHRLTGFSYESNIQLEWFTIAPDLIINALLYNCNRMYFFFFYKVLSFQKKNCN